VPGRLQDDPDARLTALLIAAPPLVVHADVISHPPADEAGIAQLIAQALSTAAASCGTVPRVVTVRTPALAHALEPLVTNLGVTVRASRELPALEDALRGLTTHLTGITQLYPHVRSNPETWRGWNIGTERVGRLFAAAAAYFRAAPWRTLADEQWLAATLHGTREWTALVLGNAGEEFGLALYADREDLEELFRAESPATAMQNPRGAVIALTYDRKNDLPAVMQREILAARWEVASPSAYPALVVLGTPGGGITAEQADDLIALLDAVPKFEREHRDRFRSPTEPPGDLTWTSADGTVRLSYNGGSYIDVGDLDPLWQAPAVLAPCGPQGKGATPGTMALHMSDRARTKLINETITDFVGFLVARRGTARSAGTLQRDISHARIFLEYLVNYEAVPPAAITEYDLREFLYGWYPRKVRDTLTNARTLPVALKRFFDFLSRARHVDCPWAAPILSDRETFLDRLDLFPGGFIFDESVQEWIAELTEDLHLRVLLPTTREKTGITWGATMGPVEFGFHKELHRLWLAWRDEVIAGGATAPEVVFDALVERAHVWATTPRSGARGVTPAKAIAREQKQHSR
jgi:hypothetical protein